MSKTKSLLKLGENELRWPFIIALLLMTLTFLPYLFGWAITPEGYKYSGFITNTDDQNVYLSYMRQARDGHLVFIDQFTTEERKPWFFHSFFLALGIFSKITKLPLIATFHLARIISGILLLLSIYLLGARYLAQIKARRFFMVFAATASGLGWLYLSILNPTGSQPHPPDFGPGLVMPEIITFLTLLISPLFCFSVFLLVCLYMLFMLAIEQKSFKLALLAGVAAIFLANIHSYDAIPVGLTIVLFIIVRGILTKRLPGRELLYGAVIGLMMLPPLLYQYSLYSGLPVFRLKAEVATLSPPLIQYLLAMGIPFLLAIPGAWISLKQSKKNTCFLFPLIWFVSALVSSYLPFPFQRKMAEGLQIPVCLLSVIFLSGLLMDIKKNAGKFALTAFLLIIVCFPSNGLFLNRIFQDLANMSERYYAYLMPPLYLRNEQVEILNLLDEYVMDDDAVLCNPMLGAYVPPRVGTRTYVGHWAETINYQQKLKFLITFLNNEMPDKQRRALLRDNDIKFVLIGPEEKAIAGGDVRLDSLPLREAFSVGEIKAYQIEETN